MKKNKEKFGNFELGGGGVNTDSTFYFCDF